MKREFLTFKTTKTQELVDITTQLKKVAADNPEAMLMAIYAKGATAAVMIQENWDPNITTDIINALSTLIPKGRWLHDRVDGNADAHIKAGIIGPSLTIPMENGKLLLSRWQNVFFCDFDGPREKRELIVTLMP